MIIPVILSGGSGTRLWPLSRELYPKQLLSLIGERTMLQATLERLEGLAGVASPIAVCNESHRFLVAEQLRQIEVQPRSIVLEPVGRNTAPAVVVAALAALAGQDNAAEDEPPVLLVLPADHLLRDVEAFHDAVEAARGPSEEGNLVTFGIVPTAPETGYGYIKAGALLAGNGGGADTVYRVERFVEKPDAEIAQAYVSSGEYVWNSGMFMFRADRYLEEVERLSPEMVSACRAALERSVVDLDFTRLDEEAFAASPADSIDYAVMEHTSRAVVVPLEAGWSDVGSWTALYDANEPDESGNVMVGDVLQENSRNCYLHAESRLVTAVGVDDHIVVETADAVLVAHRDHAQDVKALVGRLKSEQRKEALLHREVHRPWGSYSGIDVGERFQVKRISVKPGATLSLQMHYHRAEHWVVVRGTARVTRGDEVFLLHENESTYIPAGTRHRLENCGMLPLEVIEVQSGGYLGEDDIVRFDDVYGRTGSSKN